MPKKIQFHTFDALRFFAFLYVYMLHIPIQAGFHFFRIIKSTGGTGVIFFFTLSGFLITYILVHEKINVGKIHLRKFFLRRSLRIWPLYFLLVAFAFIVPYSFADHVGMHMVGGGYMPDWRFSFTFLENYKMLAADNFPRVTPLSVFWSLCIEEHFYILWMIALFFIPVKRMKLFFVVGFVTGIVARIIELKISNNQNITSNDVFTNLDLFSCGGYLGFLIAKDYSVVASRVNSISISVRRFIILAVVSFILLHNFVWSGTPFINRIFMPSVYALLFTVLLLVFIPQDSKLKIGDRNILIRLGKMSYGLYVFHLLIIHMLLQYFIIHQIVIDDFKTLLLFITISFSVTVAVSALSYRFFETPFLRWRERMKSYS